MRSRSQPRCLLPLSLLCCAALPVPTAAESPDAATIMARVAANQDAAEQARSRYTYVQHVDSSSRKGQKVLCHEETDSRVTPAPGGSSQQLLSLRGSLWLHHHYSSYTRPLSGKLQPGETREVELKDDDNLDVDLVEHLRSNLTDTKSKDGFAAGLFPLTGKAQGSYDYTLVGPERMNGRDTWHMRFRPKDNADYDWQGDVWIDMAAYQPVLVRTRLSRGVPFLVKALLGTNVPGLGFAVTYAPQADGVWFPTTFGTEFKVHVLFFLNRDITMNVVNREFQKTHADARILDETEPR